MTCWKPAAFLFALWLTLAPSGAPGQAVAPEVARAVAVSQGAQVIRGGQTARLSEGAGVASGDIIATDGNGRVQLLFADQTRVAIGPGSRFAVDDVTLRKSGTARRFAVSAIAGSFRFITGKSRKSAYAIDTPTATMGIRGTAFDFVVRSQKGTDLVLFSGEVRMCGRSGGCYRVHGACDAVRMDAGGTLGLVADDPGRKAMISHGFGFITDPDQLLPAFREAKRSCGGERVNRVTPPKEGERAPHAASPAPSPPAPSPGPPKGPPEDPPDPVI
ncbi:MAG: FecR domain-containing protein [Proteobacteria bacterium]|nr:FecR domain-containing protein [Pseudomonadota bacterium]MBS0571952.1 FecR domain-containing protein [Pseudomonadota bacterium]